MSKSDKPLRIGFIGAGSVNFGGGEGPWDHASRVEKLPATQIVAVADPCTDRAQQAIDARRATSAGDRYEQAQVYADYHDMLAQADLDAVFVGLPPQCHAGLAPPLDAEIACLDAGVPMLLEKPLSCLPPEELDELAARIQTAEDNGAIVSVGYMFRYAAAVETMLKLLDAAPGGPRAVLARYNCAYSEITKHDWWDARISGGPVVEQATHFCDLARLLAGDVDLDSIQALQISADSPAGELVDRKLGPDGQPLEMDIPPQFRPPRVTSATWRFQNGAVGSLTHGLLLHREKYESELEVWGDGLRMILRDPYGHCQLLVRRPGQETTETMDFNGDDPYLTEDAVFLQAVREGAGGIRSTYADAMKSYRLTWAIRRAAGKNG